MSVGVRRITFDSADLGEALCAAGVWVKVNRPCYVETITITHQTEDDEWTVWVYYR